MWCLHGVLSRILPDLPNLPLLPDLPFLPLLPHVPDRVNGRWSIVYGQKGMGFRTVDRRLPAIDCWKLAPISQWPCQPENQGQDL
jgi:hypothetical protein